MWGYLEHHPREGQVCPQGRDGKLIEKMHRQVRICVNSATIHLICIYQRAKLLLGTINYFVKNGIQRLRNINPKFCGSQVWAETRLK